MTDRLSLALAVVDDDECIRSAVGRLLRAHGHRVELFESAEAFLAGPREADCVILDIDLPGISGLDLDQRLKQEGSRLPVVFITAHDELSTLAAMQQSRRPFLKKPFDEACLLDAIAQATGEQD